VDFRFGSFTSFLPSRQVRFAPRADIRPMPAFMSVRPTARPKINLLKSRRSARAGCSAVRDSTPAAWYPSLYAPLKQIAPTVTRVAVVRDPDVPAGIGQFGAIQAVAPHVGVELRPIDTRDPSEIEQAMN